MSLLVAIDIDGVVADFPATANEYLANWLAVEPQPVDQWDWHVNYYEVTSREQADKAWRAMWRRFNDSDLFIECPPIPCAVTGIKLLLELGYETVFVTHRKESTNQVTMDWLCRHDLPMRVVHTQDKWNVPADVFIDDKPENVRDLVAHGKRAWLFDQPWNQDAPWRRVKGWGEVVMELELLRIGEEAVAHL